MAAPKPPGCVCDEGIHLVTFSSTPKQSAAETNTVEGDQGQHLNPSALEAPYLQVSQAQRIREWDGAAVESNDKLPSAGTPEKSIESSPLQLLCRIPTEQQTQTWHAVSDDTNTTEGGVSGLSSVAPTLRSSQTSQSINSNDTHRKGITASGDYGRFFRSQPSHPIKVGHRIAITHDDRKRRRQDPTPTTAFATSDLILKVGDSYGQLTAGHVLETRPTS